ncbi:hypothetical protein JW964_27890, partial [candidate division KSB1 bacterium]|nr:hypothetical protein [candidate division KSB1 bacterium]
WVTNAFGYEKFKHNIMQNYLNRKRDELLTLLRNIKNKKNFDSFIFNDLLEHIQNAFENALGDTQIPINDITLWDLSHSTASFFKSAVAHYINSGLKKGDLQPNFHQDIKWRYLTISVDFHHFVTNTQKLIDIIHRKKYLEDAYNDIKKLLEVHYPIANEIYRDENGMVFLAPESNILQWTADEKTGIVSLEQKILDCFRRDEKSRLLDVMPDIPQYTDLVEAGKKESTLQEALSKRKPAVSTNPADVAKVWSEKNVQLAHPVICPVCRLRPVGFDDFGKKYETADDRGICKICLNRRSGRAQNWYESKHKEPNFTIWLEETADKNGRAALLCGHFNLKLWLDGTLIEKTLLKNSSFARIRRCWETTSQFWKDILGQLDQNIVTKPCNRIRIKALHEMELNDFQAYELKIHDTRLNAVWIETENSFLTADNMIVVSQQFDENLKRVKDTGLPPELIKKLAKVKENHANEKLELFLKVFTDYNHRPEIKIQESSHYDKPPKDNIPPLNEYEMMMDEDEYFPFIPILNSPDRFYCIVPALHALTIARMINCKYQEEMGKVRDRLSLDLGIVYFPKYVPASAVLDAGRRLLEYPDGDQVWDIVPDEEHPKFWTRGDKELANEKNATHLNFTIKRADPDKSTRQLDFQIAIKTKTKKNDNSGEFENDAFHPAFRVPVINAQNQPDLGRKLAVDAGADRILFSESRFDYIFLDSASRRFETSYDSQIERRFHAIGNLKRSPRPYQIEDIETLYKIWEYLKIHLNFQNLNMTKNKLYGIRDLLQQKMLEWHVFEEPADEDALIAYHNLVENLMLKELPYPENSKVFKLLKDSMIDGSFFDCLDIYLHILKSDLK